MIWFDFTVSEFLAFKLFLLFDFYYLAVDPPFPPVLLSSLASKVLRKQSKPESAQTELNY